jgi:cytidine deaminase
MRAHRELHGGEERGDGSGGARFGAAGPEVSDGPAPPRPLDRDAAEALLEAARSARRNAYAPYSGFPVGAALLDEEGRIHPGVNVENASYGLGTCAERSAVARAMGEGARSFRAIAVVGPENDVACTPCGSCRQILHEFAPHLEVVVASDGGAARVIPLSALLPEAFGRMRLPRHSGEPQP